MWTARVGTNKKNRKHVPWVRFIPSSASRVCDLPVHSSVRFEFEPRISQLEIQLLNHGFCSEKWHWWSNLFGIWYVCSTTSSHRDHKSGLLILHKPRYVTEITQQTINNYRWETVLDRITYVSMSCCKTCKKNMTTFVYPSFFRSPPDTFPTSSVPSRYTEDSWDGND